MAKCVLKEELLFNFLWQRRSEKRAFAKQPRICAFRFPPSGGLKNLLRGERFVMDDQIIEEV
jgi:hypothetical protein